jgi:hypothetical protein
MGDRIRMKSKSTFDNPFIHNHTKDREGSTTVQDGDEFSTEAEHGEQLEQSGLAETIKGDVSTTTERQEALKGTQTSAAGAIVTNRAAKSAAAAPAKPAA